MKHTYKLIVVLFVLAMVIVAVPAHQSATAQDERITVYMQMGGLQGGGATLARTNGARAAAEALNVELIEQYSGWDQQTMIDQFNEALAADPDGIAIMGHPGEDAFGPLVAQAIDRGIIVTSGNNSLPNLQAMYQEQGFGYAGVDLYNGGYLTGQAMIAAGLEAGDTALVYGLFHEELRSRSPQGIVDALTEAGLEVDTLDISQEVNSDTSLADPIITAYLEAHPDLDAIGTQHGNITSSLYRVLKEIGYAPGEIIVGGIDLSPATVQGIQEGYISASYDQVLYLQGFLPVQQIWLTYHYKIPGLDINTGVGVVTPDNIDELIPLIEAGYR
jgi:simple sugar transport system substrate-binding protein